ncbi:MAG: Uma2 family endonuclease [Oscillospiraceae bacterium]|nr:Uma2 family endonuclease [Oscillospiraceae bacterium]
MNELINYGYGVHTKEIKEIIDGKIYYMSGGTSLHSMIIARLRDEFIEYFIKANNRKCRVHTEGLNIFLNPKDKKNYVQPDISIICDESKFFKNGYKGVPELIIEVASRKTRKRDRGDKFKTYEKSNVKEYWLIEPRLKTVEQYVLENDRYNLKEIATLRAEQDSDYDELEIEEMDDEKESNIQIITPTMFKDLEISLNKIFFETDENMLKDIEDE